METKVKTSGIFARVCGYYRAISAWNPGKQNEWKDRETINMKGCGSAAA